MEEDSNRQIDADEANRLAQEINRQVYQEIPEYSPESHSATGARPETQIPSSVLRDPPDRALEEDTYPPQIDSPTSIGGGPEAVEVLKEEERR